MTYCALHTDSYISKPRLNKHQKSVLETAFAVYAYPSKTTLKELALQTGLSMTRVYNWFVSTRKKTRQGKFVGAQSVCECVGTHIYASNMSDIYMYLEHAFSFIDFQHSSIQ